MVVPLDTNAMERDGERKSFNITKRGGVIVLELLTDRLFTWMYVQTSVHVFYVRV